MGFAPAAAVEGPPRLPLPFGLFSVVSFAEATTDRWENGVTWEALTCEPAGIVVADCDNPEGFPKQFPDGQGIGEASAFTVYGGYKCDPIGHTNPLTYGQERARLLLETQEQRAAEGRLWRHLAQDEDAEVVGDGGDDVVTVVGALEQWIADTYGSLGVIHASRFAATSLAQKGLLDRRGGQLVTALGTPVIAGGGYPGTGIGTLVPGDPEAVPPTQDSWTFQQATAGTQWIAASPAIMGYRSEIFEGSNRPGDLLDRRKNDLYGIAERNYLLGYDPCGVAFATLTLGCC